MSTNTKSKYNYAALNKTELAYLAAEFSGRVIVKGNDKAAHVEGFNASNVSADEVREALDERAKKIEAQHPNYRKPTVGQEDDVILVHMARLNPSFRFRQYRFTRQDPFVIMAAADANELMRLEPGFHIATTEEAKEFYGGRS